MQIEDIAGIKELATALHVNVTTITNWRHYQSDFPENKSYVSARPVYHLLEVVTWWMGWKPQKNIPKVGRIDDELRERALAWQAQSRQT
jgi:hypothetical protein